MFRITSLLLIPFFLGCATRRDDPYHRVLYERAPQLLGNMGSFSAALGDLDGDSDLDVFVTNMGYPGSKWRGAPDRIWINQGLHSAVFAPMSQEFPVLRSSDVELVDSDLDGDLDIITVTPKGIYHWENQQDGSGFTMRQTLELDNSPTCVATGDIDSDGDPDIVVGAIRSIMVLFNQGFRQGGQLGTFLLSSKSIGSGHTGDIELADIDDDGFLDLIAMLRGPSPNRVFLNTTSAEYPFAGHFKFGHDASSVDVEIGDLDGDGDPDLLVANDQLLLHAQVWMNSGSAEERFSLFGDPFGLKENSGAVLLDADNDKDLDAVICNFSEYPTLVFLNDGINTGIFRPHPAALSGARSFDVVAGDLNGDKRTDLFIANSGPNEVWLNVYESRKRRVNYQHGHGRLQVRP